MLPIGTHWQSFSIALTVKASQSSSVKFFGGTFISSSELESARSSLGALSSSTGLSATGLASGSIGVSSY